MIDNEVEKFTAGSAEDAGLIGAVQRGETIIQGSYILVNDGTIEFKQRNFTFTDKVGNLRVGKFFDAEELIAFSKKIYDCDK